MNASSTMADAGDAEQRGDCGRCSSVAVPICSEQHAPAAPAQVSSSGRKRLIARPGRSAGTASARRCRRSSNTARPPRPACSSPGGELPPPGAPHDPQHQADADDHVDRVDHRRDVVERVEDLCPAALSGPVQREAGAGHQPLDEVLVPLQPLEQPGTPRQAPWWRSTPGSAAARRRPIDEVLAHGEGEAAGHQHGGVDAADQQVGVARTQVGSRPGAGSGNRSRRTPARRRTGSPAPGTATCRTSRCRPGAPRIAVLECVALVLRQPHASALLRPRIAVGRLRSRRG